MQQRGKNATTTVELLLETVLCNPLLGSCNSWSTTMEMWVFSMWSVPSRYIEDSWDAPHGQDSNFQTRRNIWS
jgi:hypothetical protein